MVTRDEISGEIGIRCDAKGCVAVAPPASEIIAGNGLNNMGWDCHGGVHFCPDHANPLADQHAARREQDEYVCAKCGKRWAVDEDAPERCL